MAKRPRDRETEDVRVTLIDRDASVTPVYDSLESFVAPLTPAQFMDTEFKKRAFVARVHPKLRERRLEDLKELMDNFNPLAMLGESNSEQIHVWMKSRTTGELKSIRTDATQAKACYDAGHALYFRGSELLESTLLPPLAQALNFGFGASHRDGLRRGEIETFVSPAGHTTEWHFDFQENFTVQLKGSKKWSFRRSGVANPHRACATHFNGPEHRRTLHSQLQIARQNDPSFEGVPSNIDAECESVVLQPGDVLYHPAGIWHKVEAIGDEPSLSINLSFFPATWAEVIGETLTHAMAMDPALRERVQYADVNDARRQLQLKLAASRKILDGLDAASIMTPAVADRAGHVTVVVDHSGEIATSYTNIPKVECKKLRRNKLAILSLTPESAAFPVAMPADCGSDSEDSDTEPDTVTIVPGYVRFDVTANFMAEEGSIGGLATGATLFVEESMRVAFEKLALLAPTTVERRSLQLPGTIVDMLVAIGYLCEA